MGVTSVVKSPSHISGANVANGNQIYTGSYDQYLRLFDIRNLRRPIHETDLCGGVWRIKFHPLKPVMACAVMHGGFVVCSATEKGVIEENGNMISIRPDCGNNLGYGISVSVFGKVACCSFYDRVLEVYDYY